MFLFIGKVNVSRMIAKDVRGKVTDDCGNITDSPNVV